jgi:NADP-dependent 3-hydroxy acid dehydrogenase YdfG
MAKIALIVGAGSGISAAFARALHADGFRVILAARNTDKLAQLADEIAGHRAEVDASLVISIIVSSASTSYSITPATGRAAASWISTPPR